MDLTFLGTRGEIEKKRRRHRRHSALFVRQVDARIIDCGADWRGRIETLSPSAIVLTHGHPNHAAGIADGAPCPVYATVETWQLIAAYPIAQRRIILHREPVKLNGIIIEAFPVEHSTRAPAVGYRISASRRRVFYVPDVVAIRDQAEALHGIDLYVGDGATITRPIIRRRNAARIGHTPIRTQLDWCRAQAVTRALFTHCGSQILGDERVLGALVRRLGRERGVEARIAHDGMKLSLTGYRKRHPSMTVMPCRKNPPRTVQTATGTAFGAAVANRSVNSRSAAAL